MDDSWAFLSTVQARVLTLRLPPVSAVEPAARTLAASDAKTDQKTDKNPDNGEKAAGKPANGDAAASEDQQLPTEAKVYGEGDPLSLRGIIRLISASTTRP